MPPPITTTRLIAPRTPWLRLEFAGTPSLRLDDSPRVGHVALQLLDQVVHRRERDVGVQVADEPQLELLLVKVTFEIEQEGLDAKLGAAEGRPVADRQGGDEIALRGLDAAGVSAQRRDQLVRLDGDVRGWEAERAAHPVPRFDRARHRVFAAQQPVRRLHVSQVDDTPHVRAVQSLAVDDHWRYDVDFVPVVAEPSRAAGALASDSEVEADDPASKLHHGGEAVDELLRRQR